MSTPEYERWTALTVRRPEDVRTEAGGPVPLGWQADKRTTHNDRLTNRRFPGSPDDVERGDAGDALAVLALDEAIRRDLLAERGIRVREAMELGATWREVAAALDTTPQEARAVLREWADGQHHLHRGDVETGREKPLGLGEQAYAAVLALIELGDDETAADA